MGTKMHQTFGKLKAMRTKIMDGIIAVGAWVTVAFVKAKVKYLGPLLELGGYALITIGLGLMYSPLSWIGAGVILWILAHGSD